MLMLCYYFHKWLLPYSTGDLAKVDEIAASRVSRHLDGCDSCRRRMASLRAVDLTLRRQASASAPAIPSMPWLERNRSSSMMVRRVLSSIEPEDRFLANATWSPGAASFVAIAALAVVLIIVSDPQSYARVWFEAQFAPHQAPIVRVTAVRRVTHTATHDPFKATMSPALIEATKSPEPEQMPQVPTISIMRVNTATTHVVPSAPSMRPTGATVYTPQRTPTVSTAPVGAPIPLPLQPPAIPSTMPESLPAPTAAAPDVPNSTSATPVTDTK